MYSRVWSFLNIFVDFHMYLFLSFSLTRFTQLPVNVLIKIHTKCASYNSRTTEFQKSRKFTGSGHFLTSTLLTFLVIIFVFWNYFKLVGFVCYGFNVMLNQKWIFIATILVKLWWANGANYCFTHFIWLLSSWTFYFKIKFHFI